MKWIDGETGLEEEKAKRVKAKFEELQYENQLLRDRVSLLESENQLLKDRVSLLESENQLLRDRISMLENGGLGVRKVSDLQGDRLEFIPRDSAITQLTSDGHLKPISPNVLVIGDQENYLSDVITANVTIASLPRFKEDVRDVGEEELGIRFPAPKRYRRREGREGEEIGFVADELPPLLRRGSGYDLKALISIIAYRLQRLEDRVLRV